MSRDYVISFRPNKQVEDIMKELVSKGDSKTQVLSEAILLYYLLKNRDSYAQKLYTLVREGENQEEGEKKC